MNIDEIKSRRDFYDKELDIKRADKMMQLLISKCSLKDILWIAGNIIYDQVAYYDQNTKSRIYCGEYSNLNVDQANRFQQQLSALLDLFEQSIINKREFDENYLKDYEFAKPYLRIINEQKQRIEQLEEAIRDLNSKV